MNDWHRLKRDSPSYTAIIRYLALVGAAGVGIVLGWRTLLAPQKIPPPVQTPGIITNNYSAVTEKAISVLETGVPSTAAGEVVRVGSPAPDFTLVDLAGVLHSLSDHLNQVVLINFWTTWCPPCREEMPALQETYDLYRENGFVVLGINWTEVDDREQIEPFIQELELTFPILLDTDSYVSEDLYQLLGLPTSVFVGRDGIVLEVFIGALQLENLSSKIQYMLKEI